MFENPRRGMQAKNFTTNVPKILDLKSSSEQIFFRKLSLGAPESFEWKGAKEKERRKRKIEEKEIRRRKKSNGCTLSFYNKTEQKNCWTQKVHLTITLSKIRLEIRILKVVKSRPKKYLKFQFCVIRIEGRRDLESSRKRRKNQGIIKTHFFLVLKFEVTYD